MSNKYTNISLSNTSYTNKDFQTIFPELLQTVKTLTSKWNPLDSDTNESDPGIVLVKLLALIGDKINYNIDKNVLECFPLSATQEGNVRQLYSQLGYNMGWYRSATTNISMKYISDVKDGSLSIPPFTMVSDENNSIVYTLLGDADLNNDSDDFEVSAKEFPLDGTTVAFKAIQGVSYDYDINGETTIQAYHLDSNNRIYFSSRNVPENGVFITNVSESGTNYGDWIRKDNLLTENLNNTYYSFGVSRDGTSCYVEFPEDAENIFKDGIKITYVKTQGADGNISAETIEKFYADLTVDGVVLNLDNVKMWNYASTSNGSDPETMDEAIRNYKKLVGTFDTLITLRDYTNYISANGEDFGVSNGFACDRTCDVQSVYKIVTIDNDVNTWIPVIEQEESWVVGEDASGEETAVKTKTPTLSAFDLKLYLLNRPVSVTTQALYDSTFDALRYSKINDMEYSDFDVMKACLEDIKSIPHDYSYILPTTDTQAHICFIKNKYPIVCKIYTRQKYETGTESEIRDNIRASLFAQLNSQEVDFSDNITSDELRDIILSADNRIKKVVIEDINYTTYAVCWDGETKQYVEYPLNGDDINEYDLTSSVTYKIKAGLSDNPRVRKYRTSNDSYAVGDIVVFPLIDEMDDPSYIANYPEYEYQRRWKCLKNMSAPVGKFKERNWEEIPVSIELSNVDTLQAGPDSTNPRYGDYSKVSATVKGEDQWTISNINGVFSDTQLAEMYGVIVKSILPKKADKTVDVEKITNEALVGDTIDFGPSKSLQCRDEIFTKSILNGSTPIFEQSEEFDYTYNQQLNNNDYSDGIYRGVKAVETTDSVTFINGATTPTQLRQNESLQFLSPNLMDLATYSNYVKVCYQLSSDISKNVSRRLDTGEWVALFWKESDDDTIYQYKIYYGCSSTDDGTKYWLRPTFDMTVGGSPAPTDSILAFITGLEVKVPVTHLAGTSITGAMPATTSDQVSTNMYEKKYLLSGTKELAVQKKSAIIIDSTFYCYWILGNVFRDHYYMFHATTDYEKDEDGNILPDYINPETQQYDPTFHPSFQEYTLGTGEYFFYLKGSVSTIAVLGAGTTIRRDVIKDTEGKSQGFKHDWVAPTDATLDSIMQNGSLVLKGVWQNPYSTEENVNLVENQYITLGPKTYVQVKFKSTSALSEMTINSVLKNISADIEDVLYRSSSDSSGATMKSIKDSLSNFDDVRARALLSVNVSSNERQILFSGQNMILYDADDEIIGVSQLCQDIAGDAGTFVDVKGSMDEGSATVAKLLVGTTVEIIGNTKSTLGKVWQYIYYEGISGFVKVSQLTNKRSVTKNYIEGKDGIKNPEDTKQTIYPTVIQSSQALALDGTQTYQVATTDEEGNVKYQAIYLYGEYQDGSNVTFSTNGKAVLVVSNVTGGIPCEPVYLRFKIPPMKGGESDWDGKYLVKLSTSSTRLSQLKVSFNNNLVKNLQGVEVSDFSITNNKGKSCYFYLEVPTLSVQDELKIEITSENTEGTVNVTLSNPFRYKPPTSMTHGSFQKYMALVSKFDLEGIYDYSYQIPEANLISNPLSPASFFRTNHYLYDYVICQMQTVKDANLSITGET